MLKAELCSCPPLPWSSSCTESTGQLQISSIWSKSSELLWICCSCSQGSLLGPRQQLCLTRKMFANLAELPEPKQSLAWWWNILWVYKYCDVLQVADESVSSRNNGAAAALHVACQTHQIPVHAEVSSSAQGLSCASTEMTSRGPPCLCVHVFLHRKFEPI